MPSSTESCHLIDGGQPGVTQEPVMFGERWGGTHLWLLMLISGLCAILKVQVSSYASVFSSGNTATALSNAYIR